MSDIKRLQELFGRNPNQENINQLNSELKAINEAYIIALEAVKNGKQIDEGLFTSLSAALKTATQIGTSGSKKVAATVKKAAANVKTLYLDNKAQEELKRLVKNLKTLIILFDDCTTTAPTIMKRDAEIAKEMIYFQKLFKVLIDTISSRLAIQEGLTDEADIEMMMFEEGFIDQLSEARQATSEEMKQVYDSVEYKEATKVMKDITTPRQKKTGTLMFDTGIDTDAMYVLNRPGRYVLMAYPNGQVRGEIRGGPGFKRLSNPYRLGKPVSGANQVEIYKNALADIVKRFHKKKARSQSDESQIKALTDKYKEDLAKLIADKDAFIDDTDMD